VSAESRGPGFETCARRSRLRPGRLERTTGSTGCTLGSCVGGVRLGARWSRAGSGEHVGTVLRAVDCVSLAFDCSPRTMFHVCCVWSPVVRRASCRCGVATWPT
jgi:hypothetical protein